MSDVLLLDDAPPRDRRPLAVQVRDRLAAAIRDGRLRPGDRVPPEHDLAGRLDVGRSTVREALRLLERDGLVDVRHGRGRFVSALAGLHAERPVTEFESVTEMLGGLGYRVRNRVLRVEDSAAGDAPAEALGIAPGSPVVVLERWRLHGDEPLIYSLNVIDRRAVPGALSEHDWSGSVVELLGRLGSRIVSSAAEIRATRLPADAAPLAGAHASDPWLCVTERCVTDDGRTVLHATDHHRADVFAFHVLRRRSAASHPERPR